MQNVSTTFAPFADVRKVDFSVRFELFDVNAKAAAVPTVNGYENVTQLAQLTDDVTDIGGKWATLEDDCWVLDGSYDLLPNNVTGLQTGWWSSVLSGADGVFSNPPILMFGFGGNAISTVGYMLSFDSKTDNYPTSIRVTTYAANGTTVINQATLSNNSPDCSLNIPSQNYYSVKFEFLATSKPYRRIRLINCAFGIRQIFDRNSIGKVDVIYGADVLCEAFQSNQLTFSFNNIDHKYNLINPQGIYAYLQAGQAIYPTAVINGESVSMGKFEYTKANANDDEILAQISANDFVLLALDEPEFNEGSNTTETLQSAVNTVLSGLNITASIANPSYTVSMAIPQKTKKREAIRLLAQAAMCSVWVDRAGVLQIRPLTVATTENDELNANRMPSLGGISISEPVDSVVLSVKNEYANTETTYTAGSGKRVKNFSNPCVVAANGQTVANWILTQCNRRIKYDKANRGNPAIEIGDTLKIYDAYGENKNAVVTGQEFEFDGGLTAKTKGVGA